MTPPNPPVEETSSIARLPLIAWIARHQDKLWWLHSLYALALGMGFMWLGNRNFAFLRLAVFHIGFIWLSSLLLPKLLTHPRVPPLWAPRLRLVVNFLNKNLYQQMLFFVLPIYYSSAIAGSRNFVFVLLVGLSALLSTADIVYDRHLSVKRHWNAFFFAFNLFALVNVMLPVLWNVSNTLATRGAGVAAFAGFLSLAYPAWRVKWLRIGAAVFVGCVIFALVEVGRPFIPPAPLRAAKVELGRDFDKGAMAIVSPLTRLDAAANLRLFALTAVQAPLGLRERLQHRWYQNGKLICASPFYEIVGGREAGFRLWTSCVFPSISQGTTVRLEVETEGRQLISRTTLPSAR
jgi:hypothetical protein